MKRPAFPLYAMDWLTDSRVRAMPRDLRATYLDLLLINWVDGGIDEDRISDPQKRAALARQCGISAWTFNAAWSKLEHVLFALIERPIKEKAHPKAQAKLQCRQWVNLRVEKERERLDKRASFSKQQREKAKEKNSSLLFCDEEIALSSVSVSFSEEKKEQKKTEETPGFALLNPGDCKTSVEAKSGRPKGKKKPTDSPQSESPLGEARLPRAEVIAVVEHYQAQWTGSRCPDDGKPPKVGSADFKAASSLVTRFGVDKAKALVDRFLADSDPFLTKQAHGLRFLTARVDAYRATATPATTNGIAKPIPAQTESKLVEL